jgi:hypothetical protein
MTREQRDQPDRAHTHDKRDGTKNTPAQRTLSHLPDSLWKVVDCRRDSSIRDSSIRDSSIRDSSIRDSSMRARMRAAVTGGAVRLCVRVGRRRAP